MFTPEERSSLRDSLVARSREDADVTAAALVGSAATGHEDRWSDIDLMLRLAPGREPVPVADAWTAWLYDDHAVAAHHDVWAGPALYRVFLTRDSLQVDVSFWPDADFGARAPGFELLHGETNPPRLSQPASAGPLVGDAWLYALHVRSSLARGRVWQAVHMLDVLRDRIVELACLRSGLPPAHGRGADRLDPAWLARLDRARATRVDVGELGRSFGELLGVLLDEVRHFDPALAARLEPPLGELRHLT